MKHLFITISLLTSFAAMAENPIEMSVGATMSPFRLVAVSTLGGITTSGGGVCGLWKCKEAAQVLEDAQNYSQQGEASAFLSQKIKDIQSQDDSLSVDDAVDLLVESAASSLK